MHCWIFCVLLIRSVNTDNIMNACSNDTALSYDGSSTYGSTISRKPTLVGLDNNEWSAGKLDGSIVQSTDALICKARPLKLTPELTGLKTIPY